MSKIRINELARELEVKPNVILDLLPRLGVPEKKTHSSSLDDDVALQVRRRVAGGVAGGNGAGAAHRSSGERVSRRTSRSPLHRGEGAREPARKPTGIAEARGTTRITSHITPRIETASRSRRGSVRGAAPAAATPAASAAVQQRVRFASDRPATAAPSCHRRAARRLRAAPVPRPAAPVRPRSATAVPPVPGQHFRSAAAGLFPMVRGPPRLRLGGVRVRRAYAAGSPRHRCRARFSIHRRDRPNAGTAPGRLAPRRNVHVPAAAQRRRRHPRRDRWAAGVPCVRRRSRIWPVNPRRGPSFRLGPTWWRGSRSLRQPGAPACRVRACRPAAAESGSWPSYLYRSGSPGPALDARPGRAGPAGPAGPAARGSAARPMHPTSPLRAEPATLPTDPAAGTRPSRARATDRRGRRSGRGSSAAGFAPREQHSSRRPSIARSPSPKASPSRSFPKSWASRPIW